MTSRATPQFPRAADALGQGMTSPRARDRLIERLRAEGIKDERVLTALASLPRHLFIDEALASRAYEDTALPIGNGQTISQPWVVARMTEALIEHGMPKKVLEIGTGSGYQAAVLATLGLEVYTVERIDELLRLARRRFRNMGLNLRTKHDDGRLGWPEHAPFDGIIVTAAPPEIPQKLIDQLADGGRMVVPVGTSYQELLLIEKNDGDIKKRVITAVRFVPMVKGKTDTTQ